MKKPPYGSGNDCKITSLDTIRICQLREAKRNGQIESIEIEEALSEVSTLFETAVTTARRIRKGN